MSRVNIRIDQLKEQATELFHELGLDMTRAITFFDSNCGATIAIPTK